MSNDLIYLTYYSIKPRELTASETGVWTAIAVSNSSMMDILSQIILAYLAIQLLPTPEQQAFIKTTTSISIERRILATCLYIVVPFNYAKLLATYQMFEQA